MSRTVAVAAGKFLTFVVLTSFLFILLGELGIHTGLIFYGVYGVVVMLLAVLVMDNKSRSNGWIYSGTGSALAIVWFLVVVVGANLA
jgi:hypothetical protein